MKHKEIAEYFGLSHETVRRWSPEKRRKAIVIMQSGAEPEIIKLIGEIIQLCYVYTCKGIIGTDEASYASFYANSESAFFYICGNGLEPSTKIILLDGTSTAVTGLQKVKQTLESFIY